MQYLYFFSFFISVFFNLRVFALEKSKQAELGQAQFLLVLGNAWKVERNEMDIFELDEPLNHLVNEIFEYTLECLSECSSVCASEYSSKSPVNCSSNIHLNVYLNFHLKMHLIVNLKVVKLHFSKCWIFSKPQLNLNATVGFYAKKIKRWIWMN